MTIETMKQALVALEAYKGFVDNAHIIEGQWHWIDGAEKSTDSLRQAIAEAENQERFFCERCGKRLSGGIHTCTPPAEAEKQEPVAWMYDFLNADNRDEVIRNWTTQDYADIEREKGFNVRPLYTHPPKKQEPHSWYSAEHDEWMTNKTRKEHEALNSYTHKVGGFDLPLYTTPPQREWVGLTDEEIKQIAIDTPIDGMRFARALEAKLKEKNT